MADEQWVDAPNDDWQDVAPAAPLAQLQPHSVGDWMLQGNEVEQQAENPVGDVVGTLSNLTGAAPIAGGLAGLGTMAGKALGLTDKEPADVSREVSEALTYTPKTDVGKDVADVINYPFEKLAQGGEYLGQKTLEATGSPAAATAVDTAIQALPILVGEGARGARALRGKVPESAPVDVAPEASRPLEPATRDAKIADLESQGAALTPDDHAELNKLYRDKIADLTKTDPEAMRQAGLNQKFLQESGGDAEAADTKVDLKDHGFSDDEIQKMSEKGMADPRDGSMDREQYWNYSENKHELNQPDYVEPEKPPQESPFESREDIDAHPLPGNLDDHLDHATAKMARDMMTSDDPEMASQFTAWLEQNAHDPEQVKVSLDHAAQKHAELEPHVYEKPSDVQIDRGNGATGEESQPGTADESAQARPRESQPPAPETPASGVAEAEPAPGPEDRPAAETGLQPAQPGADVREPLSEVSARNAAIDTQREAMGLEPLPLAERKTFQASADQARAMVAKDPDMAGKLVAEHVATGRALSDPEQLVLAELAAKLGSDHAAATAEINRAREAGDTHAGLKATVERDRIETQARAVHKALNEGGGTANARGLAIRNAILKDDYSVGRNMARAEDHYGGLTERLRGQARDLSEQVRKSQEELERVQAQAEKERARPVESHETPPRSAQRRAQSPDERMQAQLQKQIDRLNADIQRRLKACPV